MEQHREVVDLGGSPARSPRWWRSAMQRAGLEYVVDARRRAASCSVDRDGWERVVLNLVANALKYTRSGPGRGAAAPGRRPAPCSPSPTPGSGSPPTELPRLFDRFHRVEGGWARSGRGQRHRARPGPRDRDPARRRRRGARASPVSGPRSPSRPGPRRRSPGASRSASSGATARTRALVDEASRWMPDGGGPPTPSAPAPRRARPDGERGRPGRSSPTTTPTCAPTSPGCSRRGAPVTAVADGDAALAAALADPPDMVVADVMMPGRNGLRAARRAARRRPDRARAGPAALRARRAGGRRRGPGRPGRRLPGQAVLGRRAAGAGRAPTCSSAAPGGRRRRGSARSPTSRR